MPKVNSSYGQVFKFAHEMELGDPVVYPIRATREIAIGEIAGPYRWAVDDKQLVGLDYHNVRPVKWLKIVPRTLFSKAALYSFGSFSSVSTSDDHLEEVIAVLKGEPRNAVETRADKEPQPVPEEVESAVESGATYEETVQATEDYLLKAWQSTAQEFEHVVAAVFEALGYTATVTRATHDHGVDVIAHPDPLGLKPPYIKVQVKSGLGKAGGPTVKQLKGAMNQGEKGVIVSLGDFANDAQLMAQNVPDVVLINGPRFVRIFLDHYEKLDPKWQAKFPLKRVYIPQA